MSDKVTIGQYIPGKSILHRADPRMKLILTFAFVILLFVISSAPAYGIISIFMITAVSVCGIPPKAILRGLKPMLFIIVFTAVLNLFITGGEPLFTVHLGTFAVSLTYEGLARAALVTLRLLYLLAGTSLLTLTTSPLQLTYSIESVMRPLSIFKVPVQEIAMMMTIALRFIPTITDEAEKIKKAQTARGADFESGNILRRAKALVPLLIPLFVSVFRRADELATAMEARCYHGGSGRTRMKQLRLTRLDLAAASVFAAFFAAALLIDIFIFLKIA